MEADRFATAVARCKQEILADIASGRVPATVASFSELHDYVDANEYGGGAEDWSEEKSGTDEFCDFWNRVQNEVDAWIKAGRP